MESHKISIWVWGMMKLEENPPDPRGTRKNDCSLSCHYPGFQMTKTHQVLDWSFILVSPPPRPGKTVGVMKFSRPVLKVLKSFKRVLGSWNFLDQFVDKMNIHTPTINGHWVLWVLKIFTLASGSRKFRGSWNESKTHPQLWGEKWKREFTCIHSFYSWQEH